MTKPCLFSIYLATDDDTARLGAALAGVVTAGDTLLLDGAIGSGKTHLARALIRARLGNAEDVPSPTFTLIQTYGPPDDEIWHADLYRLSHPDEVMELGLDDAFGRAICLVEWPDRLGSHRPKQALTLQFSPEGDGRRVVLAGDAAWAGRLSGVVENQRG